MRKKGTTHPSRSRTFLHLAGMAAAAVLLTHPGPAGAVSAGVEVEVDAECVGQCMTDLRACLRQAREDFLDCSLQGGCVELAASARLACAAGKTASVCIEARAAYADCVQPCRAELRADVRSCQNASLQCMNDECGLTDLPDQCRRVSVSTVVEP
ncbi:MAG: hypothetical protein ABR538_13260 [Candidatus Binatia bacterium]